MDYLFFKDAKDFDDYLKDHLNGPGFWIKLSKKKEPKLTYEESIDIALKYGWIDGTLKRLDDESYIKYYCQRRPISVWSTKNKKAILRLVETNQMHEVGLKAVEIAKSNGCWDKADLPPNDFSIEDFMNRLSIYSKAYGNFMKMTPSVQKTYALSYYTLKTAEARERRLSVIVTRLELNLKPMDPIILE